MFLILTIFSLASCGPQKVRKSAQGNLSDNNLGPNQAFVMLENPVVQSGINAGSLPLGIAAFVSSDPQEITDKTILEYDCLFKSTSFNKCFQVQKDIASPALSKTGSSWHFSFDTDEFLQVQSFFHTKKAIARYFEALNFINDFQTGITTPLFPFSFPYDLESNKNFWFSSTGLNDQLKVLLKCQGDHAASYNPAGQLVCLGGNLCSDPNNCMPQNFSYAEDPSVLYHEMGHAFVQMMINSRNSSFSHKVDLGSNLFYDEAGAINEGLADYFSYVMTDRTHMGEWAIGRAFYLNGFTPQSRAMREDDALYTGTQINLNDDSRLSYPQYIMFDPNSPTTPLEDVHYTGQIVSHYLVSLTEKIKSTCSIDQDRAEDYVLLTLAQTLSFLGDQSSKGSDAIASDSVNLNSTHSIEWQEIANPINFRKFFQTFSRNLLYSISANLCNGFDKSTSEKLLDMYGLLLFKNYNDNLYNPVGLPNHVTESNRTLSSLISKDLIDLPSDPNQVTAYIMDDPSQMNRFLNNLVYQGSLTNISTPLTGTNYNNANGLVSPGEIVGISLNLINNSNVEMGGVQVLANDFDHMDTATKKPCSINSFPTNSEGGISGGSCAITNPNDSQPVCLVQYNGSSATEWVSQDYYRLQNGISNSNCLNSGASMNGNECLIRVLPGASHAFLSKIDPHKTWATTIQGTSTSAPIFNSSTLIGIEVNKFTPPGTLFNCRLRVRFSNCADCFEKTTNNEYTDSDYASNAPFKLINFQFRVGN